MGKTLEMEVSMIGQSWEKTTTSASCRRNITRTYWKKGNIIELMGIFQQDMFGGFMQYDNCDAL